MRQRAPFSCSARPPRSAARPVTQFVGLVPPAARPTTSHPTTRCLHPRWRMPSSKWRRSSDAAAGSCVHLPRGSCTASRHRRLSCCSSASFRPAGFAADPLPRRHPRCHERDREAYRARIERKRKGQMECSVARGAGAISGDTGPSPTCRTPWPPCSGPEQDKPRRAARRRQPAVFTTVAWAASSPARDASHPPRHHA